MKELNKQEKRMKHITDLAMLFGYSYVETKVIFMKLKGIEMGGHKIAEKYCNGEIDSEIWERYIEDTCAELKVLLPNEIFKNIHLNGDPRGYFLKIDDDYMRANREIRLETDWGGYGILCPEGV